MQKNNSYIIKVENICPKRYLEILVAFIVLQFLQMIRLYFLGLAVLFTTLSTLLNKKHTFLPKWLLIIKTFRFYQNCTKFYQKLPNFLENSRNFTKSKTFYQIWSHWHDNTLNNFHISMLNPKLFVSFRNRNILKA
jgi:hypothetical protein